MFAKNKKGVTNLIATFIGLAIVIVIVVQTVVPIINDAINNSNLTGPAATLLNLVPFLIIVVLVLLIVALMRTK